jgi:acyl-coenzyme A synthetase/AMP-(fatty) acid ligase
MVIGCTHVIVPMFTPGGVAAAISEHKVTDVLLVPTMIQMLIDAESPVLEGRRPDQDPADTFAERDVTRAIGEKGAPSG